MLEIHRVVSAPDDRAVEELTVPQRAEGSSEGICDVGHSASKPHPLPMDICIAVTLAGTSDEDHRGAYWRGRRARGSHLSHGGGVRRSVE